MTLRRFLTCIFGPFISRRVCGLEGMSINPVVLPDEGTLEFVAKSGVTISEHRWRVESQKCRFLIESEESCMGGTLSKAILRDGHGDPIQEIDISDARFDIQSPCGGETNLIGDGDSLNFAESYAL